MRSTRPFLRPSTKIKRKDKGKLNVETHFAHVELHFMPKYFRNVNMTRKVKPSVSLCFWEKLIFEKATNPVSLGHPHPKLQSVELNMKNWEPKDTHSSKYLYKTVMKVWFYLSSFHCTWCCFCGGGRKTANSNLR